MKLAYWIILSSCIGGSSFAQSKIDSLKALLKISKTEGKTENVSTYLSHIGWEFLALREYDSALSFYYNSLATSDTYPELKASTLDCMGVAYNFKGFPDSSIYYYSQALGLYSDLKDTAHAVIIENNLSIIYRNKGLYEKSLETAFSALSKLEKQNPTRAIASCFNTIGSVYSKIGDHANALIYYRKALDIRRLIDYTNGVGQSYNNIGETYAKIQLYDSALSNLFRALDIKRQTGEINSMGTTLNSIGEVYLDLSKLREAEPYFIESRNIKKESGERLEEAMALNNLGKLKLMAKDLNHAENFLREAEILVRKTGGLDELRKNLELNVWLYKNKPDKNRALSYAEELITVKDSLLNTEKAETLLSMQARYESEKKEQQISMLEQDKALQYAEIETKRIWIRSLIGTVSLGIIILGLLFYNYRQSQQNKRKVETLLQELHHRVKNNLQLLSSILSLQSNILTDHNAIQVMKTSESRVNTMALIHKKLYGGGNARTINLKEYIFELVQYLIHTYDFQQRNIAFKLNGNDIQLDVDRAIPVGLIINEIVSNALKYAFTDHAHPRLSIEMSTANNTELYIQINDNGPGIRESSLDEEPSFGLKMVNTLTKELKGKLTVNSKIGTTFILQIPIT